MPKTKQRKTQEKPDLSERNVLELEHKPKSSEKNCFTEIKHDAFRQTTQQGSTSAICLSAEMHRVLYLQNCSFQKF